MTVSATLPERSAVPVPLLDAGLTGSRSRVIESGCEVLTRVFVASYEVVTQGMTPGWLRFCPVVSPHGYSSGSFVNAIESVFPDDHIMVNCRGVILKCCLKR